MSDLELSARLVAAADAERRRIEGELHDGVQQDLVALAVSLELVRTLADSDPAAAKKLLEEIRREVQQTLEGVRAVAHGIYPPILPTRGLADALLPASAHVDVTVLGRYPLEVEQIVYFCCVDLLTHTTGRATVRVWDEEDALCFEVAADALDDGDLSSVRDRLAALGGRLTTSGEGARGTVPL